MPRYVVSPCECCIPSCEDDLADCLDGRLCEVSLGGVSDGAGCADGCGSIGGSWTGTLSGGFSGCFALGLPGVGCGWTADLGDSTGQGECVDPEFEFLWQQNITIFIVYCPEAGLDQASISVVFGGSAGDGATFGATGEAALAIIASLCNTGGAALPFVSQLPGNRCDWSTATVAVGLL